MRAFIIAGGKGKRLKGYCDGIPKPMISIVGRPVLEHQTAMLCSDGVKAEEHQC